MTIHETVNQIGLLFFYCSKSRRKDKENEKYRRKDFNGRRRNQAVTKEKNSSVSRKRRNEKREIDGFMKKEEYLKVSLLKAKN
jgi:hypothetical protein